MVQIQSPRPFRFLPSHAFSLQQSGISSIVVRVLLYLRLTVDGDLVRNTNAHRTAETENPRHPGFPKKGNRF
ncbi:protein of unknown function [Candidatus Methylomirabilis oxygeniifera]|uniref:Uncharacterized protein n=1 Tax=Methylomirabilis oxygeniifera TaxID=671143 RepID=D5MFA9_METO1|nr:protein of unknown function [Candidatus Methylomirabilis oxyfera]